MFFLRDVLLSSPVICVALHEAIRTESFLVSKRVYLPSGLTFRIVLSYFSYLMFFFLLLLSALVFAKQCLPNLSCKPFVSPSIEPWRLYRFCRKCWPNVRSEPLLKEGLERNNKNSWTWSSDAQDPESTTNSSRRTDTLRAASAGHRSIHLQLLNGAILKGPFSAVSTKRFFEY